MRDAHGIQGTPTGRALRTVQDDDPLMGPGGFSPENIMATISPQALVRGLERVRRHRLVRLVSLGILVLAVALLPGALSEDGVDIPTLLAILLVLVGAASAYLINRFNRATTASYVLLGGLMLAIGWDIASKPLTQSGLDLNDLRLYGLFVLPILLAGVLSGRRGPFIVCAIAIIFTAASLILLHKTPELQAYWDASYADAPGTKYDVVALPLVILLMTSIAAWLGADSVQRALLRAARADELSAANERVLALARQIELQRRRLQDGIQHMQQVHAAFARGQFDARARVTEGDLLPLGVSLNHLLDRMQRLSREQEQRARMEQGIREMVASLKRVRSGEGYAAPDYTGTPLDEVLVELATLMPMRPGMAMPAGPSRPFTPGANAPYAAPNFGPNNGAFGPLDAPAPAPPSTGRAAASQQPTMPVLPDAPMHGNPPASGTAGQVDPRELLPDWLRAD